MFRRYVLSLAILQLIFALGPAPCAAQVEGQALAQARSFADSSLKMYVTQVLKSSNARRFGFKDMAQAQAAQLGDPIPVQFIGLKTLKSYRAGAGIASVLTDAKTLWFPVLAGGAVVAKLEISEVQGKWLAGEFGRPALAQQIGGIQRELPAALQRVGAASPGKVSLVRVPALSVELLLSSDKSGSFLVPVQRGDLGMEFEVGKAYPAEDLLGRLAELAQKVDEKTVR